VRYYPALLNISGKKCVVVGGGEVAFRKVKMLLECGGKVTVISPKPHPEMAKLSEEGAIHFVQKDYEAGDLKDAFLAVAGTNVNEINRRVADEAKKEGVLLNVVDDPEQSGYIVPSLFRRGDLTIAISTGGTSPALARKIRAKLEQEIGGEYASLLSLIGEVRSLLKKKGYLVSPDAWQEAIDLDSLAELVRAGQRERAKADLLKRLEACRTRRAPSQEDR
jgi:siroheme synthase-like protein